MVKIRIKQSARFEGVVELARRVNRDKSHVSRVLRLERRSALIEEEARRMGWQPGTLKQKRRSGAAKRR